MTIRINNLSLGLDDDINLLKKKASKKLRISADEITNFKIVRESIDARNKDNIKLTYAIELEHKNEEKLSRTQELNTAKVQALRELGYTEINEENAKEVLEKIAEIQSRKV